MLLQRSTVRMRWGIAPISVDRRLRVNTSKVFFLSTTPVMSSSAPIPIHAPALREWVLSKQPKSSEDKAEHSPPPSNPPIPKSFKIVDVRDDDYIGGHIPGTLNVPSQQFSSRVGDLVDELKENEAVVFTCALSQQRGPNAAQKYFNRLKNRGVEGQKVYVLKDGFFGWQARYGKDKALTEEWDKEVWEYY